MPLGSNTVPGTEEGLPNQQFSTFSMNVCVRLVETRHDSNVLEDLGTTFLLSSKVLVLNTIYNSQL